MSEIQWIDNLADLAEEYTPILARDLAGPFPGPNRARLAAVLAHNLVARQVEAARSEEVTANVIPGGRAAAWKNPEDAVIDAIDELVNDQLDGYADRSGYDHDVNQERCELCSGPWHGLPAGGDLDLDEFDYDQDDSRGRGCPGAFATDEQVQAWRGRHRNAFTESRKVAARTPIVTFRRELADGSMESIQVEPSAIRTVSTSGNTVSVEMQLLPSIATAVSTTGPPPEEPPSMDVQVITADILTIDESNIDDDGTFVPLGVVDDLELRYECEEIPIWGDVHRLRRTRSTFSASFTAMVSPELQLLLDGSRGA